MDLIYQVIRQSESSHQQKESTLSTGDALKVTKEKSLAAQKAESVQFAKEAAVFESLLSGQLGFFLTNISSTSF